MTTYTRNERITERLDGHQSSWEGHNLPVILGEVTYTVRERREKISSN